MQSQSTGSWIRWVLFRLAFALAVLLTTTVPSRARASSTPDATTARLARGQAAMLDYAQAQKRAIRPGTPDEAQFLLEVLNDQHPALLKGAAGDDITFYAITTLGLVPDLETPTVDLKAPAADPQPGLWVTYDHWAARNYTYQWTSWNGGTVRNPDYASFAADCTNFMSQALRAGGIAMAGSGSGGDENNSAEWYMHRAGSGWAWSHPWSVVRELRYYLRDRLGAYVEAYGATNEAVSLLISRAREGDIVQFDVRDCPTCAWTPTHAVMISTKRNNGGYHSNDLTYNDHTGGSWGQDTRDGSLRGKFTTWSQQGVAGNRRMVWIKLW